jgi:CheY-like chemotaxis protein
MIKRILYVEDLPQNMLLVRRILEALGHELLEAANGELGWEMVVGHHPDLILMDLRLPGETSGFDLIRRVKGHPEYSRIPVVVLTAYGFEEVEQKATEAGCDDFLIKPADIRQIRMTLEKFLNQPAANQAPDVGPEVVMTPLVTTAYTFI